MREFEGGGLMSKSDSGQDFVWGERVSFSHMCTHTYIHTYNVTVIVAALTT